MSRTVLVVDDNPMNAQLAGIMLKRAGFKVCIAESAAQALDVLTGTPVDVVLTDISMPGTSGKELCRTIRERYGDGRPLVVAFTAFAMPHQRLSILEAGFDGIVVKPASAGELVSAVSGGFGSTPVACAA